MALSPEDKKDVSRAFGKKTANKVESATRDAKSKALKAKAGEKRYTFHDIRSGVERDAPYSEVRSSLKKNYPKSRVNRVVRDMVQNLKPKTSEGIPSSGGYYHRYK